MASRRKLAIIEERWRSVFVELTDHRLEPSQIEAYSSVIGLKEFCVEILRAI